MASSPRQPKGILKKPAPSKQPSRDQARQVALQHAQILQQRKDLEAEILDSLILLSEYPAVTEPPYDAADPAADDIADFKAHVRLFQPSDYDDLIEERNVNGLCGYTLCAKPRRQYGPGGEWKLTSAGIVKRKDLEKWCSPTCARRALYVKVQLNETAAWERLGIPDIEIELLPEETGEAAVDDAAQQLGALKLEDQRQAARDTAALALERGEQNNVQGKVSVSLFEKEVGAPSTSADTSEVYDDDHLVVEGYKSKTKKSPAEQ